MRVTPRASRNEIAGERDGTVLVRVSAPPADGRANDAVRKLLAKALGVAQGKVTLERGERSREKRFRVEGLSEQDARARLARASNDRPA